MEVAAFAVVMFGQDPNFNPILLVVAGGWLCACLTGDDPPIFCSHRTDTRSQFQPSEDQAVCRLVGVRILSRVAVLYIQSVAKHGGGAMSSVFYLPKRNKMNLGACGGPSERLAGRYCDPWCCACDRCPFRSCP